MNRTFSPSRPLRQAGAILLAALAIVAALVTVSALGAGRNAVGAIPSASPSTAPTTTPTATATATPRPTPVVTPDPTQAPTPDPTQAPTPDPTQAPTDEPSDDPAPTEPGDDAMPIKVDLDNATGADVYVDIVDKTGDLAGARTGDPGDGASVEPYTLQVRNLDQRTFELTWVDYPIDNALALYITREGDGYRLVLIQPEPTEPTDAVAFDRMLIIEFEHDVELEDIEAELQGAENNAG